MKSGKFHCHAYPRARSRWPYAWFLAFAVIAAFRGLALAGVPDDGTELIERRTREAKHFRLPDGSLRAVISAEPVHYQDMSGNWQEIALSFHVDETTDDLADHNSYVVRSNAWGLTMTDWWGRGVLWLTPARPSVSGGEAIVSDELDRRPTSTAPTCNSSPRASPPMPRSTQPSSTCRCRVTAAITAPASTSISRCGSWRESCRRTGIG